MDPYLPPDLEPVLEEDVLEPGMSQAEQEQALGAEYHRNHLGPRPPVPHEPAWWCAVHQRPLTYKEAARGECSWCADPLLLVREQRTEDDDVGQKPLFGQAPSAQKRKRRG